MYRLTSLHSKIKRQAVSNFATPEIACQSGRIDRGRLNEALFNLSSILIYASMTMSARLRGAAAVSAARLRAYAPLCLQMCAAEKRGSEPGLISPSTRTRANGINRDMYIYICTPLPLGSPVSTLTCYPRVKITLFMFLFHSDIQLHLKQTAEERRG